MFGSLRSPTLILFAGLSTLAACGGPARSGLTGEPGTDADPAEETPDTGGRAGTGGGSARDAGSAGQGGAGAGGSGGAETRADAAAASDTGTSSDTSPADAGTGAEAGGTPTGAAVPSAACAGGAIVPGPNGNQSMMATGKNRSFIIRMPTSYDGKKPYPMLLFFHGAGGGASAFEGGVFGNLSRMAADKAIRIFPQAYGGNTWSRDENDDVLFMDALVEWLGTRVCYDKSRVYATGQSSGAYFSHRFACDRGNIVRAVATNSGGQRRERALDCKVPISAWTSTGAADNPGHVMGTQQAAEVWAKVAGCSLTGQKSVMPPPCVAYQGCREGYDVHFCKHSGGHAPPSYAIPAIYNFLFNSKL
jgi:poly(3-hydroxybutyrate) depolymerase